MNKLLITLFVFSFSITSTTVFSQSVNVLILGSTESIESGYVPYNPTDVALELESILNGDADYAGSTINVQFNDIHRADSVVVSLGGNGSIVETWIHKRFSLFSYCTYPADKMDNIADLKGQLNNDWDYVVIMGDPYMVSLLPGYYALGVNKVLEYIKDGGAEAFLFMQWPHQSNTSTIDHFEEVTYRIGEGAASDLTVIPAGLAWDSLSTALIDTLGNTNHPTPNGAYLAAASIYSSIFAKNANYSSYSYNSQIADRAYQTVIDEVNEEHYDGIFEFVSPFSSCNIVTNSIDYLHTGSSTENGFQAGFIDVLQEEQLYSTNSPYNFNYGRANYYFEAWKRYKNNDTLYPYALGFPMQDHSNSGDSTTFYGIDYRYDSIENGTDLGVARYMLNVDQASHLRAIPVRSITAELLEVDLSASVYSDPWHLSSDVNRAVGSYMFTILTGKCGLQDSTITGPSAETYHTGMKVGYNTAWTNMHLKGKAPGFRVVRSVINDTVINPVTPTTINVSFLYQPEDTVKVTISSDNDNAVDYGVSELIFTPNDYDIEQTVSIISRPGTIPNDQAKIYFTAESNDIFFNDFYDVWDYAVERALGTVDVRVECDSLTWIDGNTYYTDNDTATYTYINGAVDGSDSIVVLDLTINTVNSLVTQSGAILEAVESGATYQWLECPGMTPIFGATDQLYTASSNGDYAVVVSSNGCSDTSSCYSVVGIGILENNFGDEIQLYPNPTDGIFSIDLGENYQNVTLSITDLNGKQIQSEMFHDSQLLNVELEHPAGVYLLVLEAGDKKAVVRLVKED